MIVRGVLLAAMAMMTAAVPAAAQDPVPPAIQTMSEAVAQDAGAVATRLGVDTAEAGHQLRLQEASGEAVGRIAQAYTGRLAGIAFEHAPRFRILVRLTGDAPAPDETIDVAGEPVEVAVTTGAIATHVELVQAIASYQAAIRASLIVPPGLGVDQRTGELVAVVSPRDVAREGADPLRDRLAALTQVPVRLRVVDDPARDLSDPAWDGVKGGMRMMGGNPGDPRQYVCTAGFVVTDGVQTALSTAAHCPDTLSVRDAAGQMQVLPFAGQWGWGHQDVQINLSAAPLAPLFFADSAKRVSRAVTGARGRAATYPGEIVCHRGERTGFSCSTVELTDFAPAGDLCGGACLPTWTTVAGPVCKGGDSGSPVFAGGTAYGILKGGSYRADGSCAFYFYMSTDYLPEGWRLLTSVAAGQP